MLTKGNTHTLYANEPPVKFIQVTPNRYRLTIWAIRSSLGFVCDGKRSPEAANKTTVFKKEVFASSASAKGAWPDRNDMGGYELKNIEPQRAQRFDRIISSVFSTPHQLHCLSQHGRTRTPRLSDVDARATFQSE